MEEIDKLRQDKAALISRVASLEQSLYWLRKKVFGRMSEKNLPLDPNQLFLFSKEEMSSMEISRMEDEVRKSDEEITRTIKVKEKPSRKPLDTSSLPVEVVDLYPEGTTDGEGRLKDDFIEIGKEESSRLERVPAKVYILKTVRHKVIRKSDMEKYPEERQILIHPLPLVPVSKCMAGASVLTDIIIGKFMYHLPFYRLIQQYRESGIIISESTMCGWYEMAVEKLRLLYNLLKQKILSSEYIQVDESIIPVLDNEKHKAKKGYEWCVRDGITGDVMFHYDRGSRSGMVARELLGCYRGTVQCDGYAAYEQFERMKGITLVGCWAHARRKYVDALEENRTLATQAIHYIGKLYKIESEANDAGLTTVERKEKRINEAYPLILEFEKWLQDAYLRVLPKSRMGKAIEYTYTLLPRLSRYVNDGRIEIDDNRIENAIRPLALGRKNYLFCGNDASAYRAAIVYSLIATCKSAEVDPRIWMEDVLSKIPYYERDDKNMEELLPRNWAKSHQNLFRINTISSESTTNNTDSELIHKICNVVYRMLTKQKYFLTDFFILSAEKQPIKLSWRNIEWLHYRY